jgi:hypothetical protein
MKPRKHAALIKAWADGAEIQQYRENLDEWRDCSPYPVWDERLVYRVKPTPKKVTMYLYITGTNQKQLWLDKESPETFVYRTISDYIGSIEVTK